MSQHLFLFTIGPVQSFIAQARKTQDLYAGSRILSELIKKGIKTVKSKNHTIIFPFAQDFNTVESLPNRFVALIEEGTDLTKLGQEVEKAVRTKWESIAQTVFTNVFWAKIQAQQNIKLDFAGINQQVEQHLDIHWIFEEYTEGANYADTFKRLEQKLGAIKNVRTFQQFNYNGLGECGRKCSVDGYRNVKFYRRSLNQERWEDNRLEDTFLFATDNFKFEYQDSILRQRTLQAGEGLSAVSFVKRSYKVDGQKREEFESTAEIALLKTIQFLRDENQNIDDFEKNPQLFFKDNLNENYFKKQDLNITDISKYEDKLKAFEKLAKNQKPQVKFPKYYAILAFDGDSMGEWLSKASSWQEHQSFSELLIDFAQKAKAYLDNDRGRAVYAGGDDFLGFVNLEYLFDVLIWMRDTFKTDIADKMPFKNGDKTLTFSAGVCIAHYKEPLSIVLNRARQMEHKAKDWRNTKDSFGIAVIKGSGEDHETVWGFENQSLENIQFLIDEMRKENLSNTFLKSFQREFAPILKADGTITFNFQKLIKKELERLVYRSCTISNKEQKEKKADEVSTTLIEKLLPINRNVSNFFSLLNIADFLHRTLNQLESEKKIRT